MSKLGFTVFMSLVTLLASPVRANESQASLGTSQVNLHIGGGIGVPLDPTGNYAGIGGTFQAGAGPNLGIHHSIVGEFMWHTLPPNQSALLPVVNALCLLNPPAPPSTVCSAASIHATDNVYALTANYMYHKEGKRFGYYAIGGGGWYYRKAELKNFTVPPGTACVPAWGWWGYTCQGGFVTNSVLGSRGVSSGGINGGGGFTIGMTSGLKFYIEARYHYSPQGGRVSTKLMPVTMGIRW